MEKNDKKIEKIQDKYGKVGFSTRGKIYMHGKKFFSADRTFEGELVKVKRVLKKDDNELGNDKLFSYHRFIIKKGNKENTFIYKGHKDMDFTNYFHVGDHVRHISGYEIPEKYDKSKDSEVLCIVCGEFTSIERNHCQYCGEVLLK